MYFALQFNLCNRVAVFVSYNIGALYICVFNMESCEKDSAFISESMMLLLDQCYEETKERRSGLSTSFHSTDEAWT